MIDCLDAILDEDGSGKTASRSRVSFVIASAFARTRWLPGNRAQMTATDE